MRKPCVAVLLVATNTVVATAQLTGRHEQDARTVLQAGAAEAEPDARRELAIALSLISSRDPSAQLLETLATDKDHLVREAAITSLGELGDRRKLNAVKSALNDEVPEVVFAAARALYRLDPAQGRPVLVSILERETAAKSGFIRGQFRTVLRRMRTPRSALVFAVQQGAGFIPVPGLGAGMSAMNSMLLDADFSARAYALTLIAGERSRDRTTQLLAEALTDEEWSVRAAAVQAIAAGGRTNLRNDLGPLFADRDRKVRFRAAAAYLRLRYVTAPKR
jgi:HEAT repeat protein